MADALMGVTETSAAAIDVVSSQAQMYLQQASKMMPVLSNYSNLVVPGSKSVKVPRAAGFASVDDKSENTALDAQILTIAEDTIDLTSHKAIQWLIEDIASEQTAVAILQMAVERASKDIARTFDQDAVNLLEAASASTPDHRIPYANTTDIAEADILDARELLIKQFLDPSECFLGVSPANEKAMLKLANFIDSSKYGSPDRPLFSGEIGRVFGVRVIVHNDFEDLKSIMWHPTAVGYAMQFGPRFQSESDLANLGTRYSLDTLRGQVLLDSGKRCVMIGTAS